LPKPAPRSAPLHVRVDAHDHRQLVEGWQVASCPPDAHADPTTLEELNWLPARVPGTAAGALRDAGRWRPGDERDLDSEDWWFRTRFDAHPAGEGEELALQLGGIATVAEVFLNGVKLLASDSMFASHSLDVGAELTAENELAIRCRALAPMLRERRKPRARWRTSFARCCWAAPRASPRSPPRWARGGPWSSCAAASSPWSS